MSKIAEALVKAKERTGTTIAPFFAAGSTGAPPPPPVDQAKEKALRKARNTQRFWVALLSVAAVLTLLVIWNRLNSEAPHGAPVAAAPSPAPSPAAKPEPAAHAQPAPATPPKPETTPLVLSPSASSAAPRLEIYNVVNALVITAVLPGERPRLMYKGRIVAVGEPVEGELVFAGVQDERLVFNDRRGAIYTRRY